MASQSSTGRTRLLENKIEITPIIRVVLALAAGVVMFFPLYVNLIGSFKTNGQILAEPFGIPSPINLEPFSIILSRSGEFWTFFYNSVIIGASTILVTLFCAMSAGVALTRLHFRGRTLLFNFFIMGLLFPLTVAILPLYLQLRNFGLTGSRLGVILAEAAFQLPLSIFIFAGFFRDVPWELQDAVNIDGGGIITFAVRVLAPISAPVVTTVTIITLIMSWNQFLLPLIVLSDQETFTIPLGVMQFQGQFTTGWNYIMAFITLAIIPMLLLYIFLQRYIVAGLTAGATKG
ncbi:MAG: carbohydrate ABC transporter permease [Spirochaetota bacterium]